MITELSTDFSEALKSPSYILLDLAQDKSTDSNSFYSLFHELMKLQSEALSEVIVKSENLISIDVKKLLNTDVYEGLKYYQDLSK